MPTKSEEKLKPIISDPDCECGEPESAGIHDPVRTWVSNPNKLHAFRLYSKDTSEVAALKAETHEPAVDDFGNQYLARVPEMHTVRRVGKIAVQEPVESSMPITKEQLAWALCRHAQQLCYDHGANPTVDWNVGACPRHIGMAYDIFKAIREEVKNSKGLWTLGTKDK